MSWAAIQSAVSAGAIGAFGEPVTLPGEVVVMGVFEPQGRPVAPWGSEVGLAGRMSQQANPTVTLAEADAAGLADGDQVQIRAAAYLVVRRDPDGAGMVRVELMPAAAADGTVSGVWR